MSRARRAEALRIQAIGPSPVLPATTIPDTIRKSDAGGTGVKPAPFAYAKARSLDEAIDLLGARRRRAPARRRPEPDRHAQHAAVRADAADRHQRHRRARPASRVKDGTVEIGALVRHAQAERSAEIAEHAPLIALALPHIAHPAIRNRGTIGGSLAFADPAAELPACVLALGGEVGDRRRQRQAHGQGRRFLQGPVRDRAWPAATC